MGLLVLAGCGSGGSGNAPATARRESLRSCVSVIGSASRAGGSLNVKNGDGLLVAEITTWPTVRKATKFFDQLVVPGDVFGRRVAVWDAAANSDDKTVIGDCLSRRA